MKIITFFRICMVLFLVGNMSFAQVGIGTTTPNGILDINSSIYGVVYPSEDLTSTLIEIPVINPTPLESIVIGTTIYNNNTTITGSNDVEPGIYSWDGTKWVTHFFKRQSELFVQTSSIRTSSNLGFEDITGLGVSDSKTFIAKYSGLYKIEVKVNYGAGDMTDNGDVNTAMGKGDFRFIFDTTTYTINAKSFSTYNDHIGGGTLYSNVWVQTTKTIYINLIQGQTYSWSLEFDQYDGPGFISNGDSGTGRGYVGEGIPCYIEFTYIDE